jgi:DMSO/TMAO reductase YedYZ molybdopterin-dependent catalytic subunit
VGRFVGGVWGGAGGDRAATSSPITPNDDFYLISKNFLDPTVDEDDWRLEISGLVTTPRKLTYADLLALPAVEQLTTLTCISNEVGGDLISNAKWTGVRLADLLELAGIGPAVADVALFAADGYSESIPLSKALEPTTILAHRMNDERLPSRHGFPARLVVPGRYGIKNVKWLRRIELVAGDFRGYWQQRGWTDDATIQTMSRFDVPRSRDVVSFGPVDLAGIAFAGDRGISRVQISFDDGSTWRDADTLERIGPLSWVIWRSTWNPPGRGAYRLRIRAIDGAGEVQRSERRKPIPDGATGYHRIDLGVA